MTHPINKPLFMPAVVALTMLGAGNAQAAPPGVTRLDELTTAVERLVKPRSSARFERQAVDLQLPQVGSEFVRLTHRDSGIALGFRANLQQPESQLSVSEGWVGLLCDAPSCASVLLRQVDGGVEDYIWLDDAAVSQVTYDLELRGVAGLRLVSNTLELLDASGAPRLRMAPPAVVDSEGKWARATVHLDGCHADTNPAMPFGRPVVAPGTSACKVVLEWSRDGLTYPVVLDPSWTETGRMIAPRGGHELTALPGDRVLAAAGSNGAGQPAVLVSEIYDRGSASWAASGELPAPRIFTAIARWGTDKVLMVGGFSLSQAVASPLTYDIGTGTWSAGVPDLNREASVLSATTLSDGSIVVGGGCWQPEFGGDVCVGLSIAARLGPGGSQWEYYSPPAVQAGARLIGLSGDRIGLFGSFYQPDESPNQIFEAGAWRELPSIPPRGGAAAIELPGNRVLLVGGNAEFDDWNSLETEITDQLLFDLDSGAVSTLSPQRSVEPRRSALFQMKDSVLWLRLGRSSLLAPLDQLEFVEFDPQLSSFNASVQLSNGSVLSTGDDGGTFIFTAETGSSGGSGGSSGGGAGGAGGATPLTCGAGTHVNGAACVADSEDGGCGCRIWGHPSSYPRGIMCMTATALLWWRRRRR